MRSEREYDGKQYKVSIHAPVMGANMRALALLADGSFNPRTRDGCEKEIAQHYLTDIVSIHAPVMGANTYELEGYSMSMFQSTHP